MIYRLIGWVAAFVQPNTFAGFIRLAIVNSNYAANSTYTLL